uniref:Uncharacterized protein n=1 Tax=Panagrolaimus superbus TaxID=310955 RepID=A0A914YQP6_9BILA
MMTESESEKKQQQQQLKCGKFCVVGQIKEIYQKALETDKEMLEQKPQTEEEFEQSIVKAISERTKLDPNISYDTFKEEIIEIFKSEDQVIFNIYCML